MAEARDILTTAGFANVSTYLQSGNVLLDSEKPPKEVEEQIEQALPGNPKTIVRSLTDLQSMIDEQPFGKQHPDEGHSFVTFLKESSDNPLKFKESSELVLRTEQEIFWYARPTEGRFDYPDLERQLKVPTTTRNWRVVKALANL